MLTTPAEAIKKIENWYKTDMNQPIALIVDDVGNLYETLEADTRFAGLYKTDQDIPKELIDKCFGGVSNDEAVWKAIHDSYFFDIEQHIDKQVEAEKEIETDEPLWDN